MKTKIIFMSVLIAAVMSVSGCLNNVKEGSADKISVVTTLFPLYEFTKEVGGDKVEVILLLPPGAEAHTFEPKPSDIKKINSADIFLYVGAGMEPWAHDIVEGSNNKDLLILDASSKVTLLKSEEHENIHEEGEHSFEWAGVFELDAGEYTWTFAKVDGKYADTAMKIIILETEDSDAHGITHIEEKAEELMGSSNLEIKNHGSTLIPRDAAYQLIFEEDLDVSSFKIKIEKKGNYIFFTEHAPFEFEAGEHFFKDSEGKNMEPSAEEPESGHGHTHEHETTEEGHHHHGEYDPHIWLDFENDQKIVNAIAESLSQKDPSNVDFYLKKAQYYNAKLCKLHEDYASSLSNCKQHEFISGGHNAFAYLAHKYNLETISAFGISPDSEPTPQKIKEIVDLTKERGIKYIYFEKLVNPKMAETIAGEVGAKTLVLNPAHNLLKEQFQQGITFISLMEENLINLKTGLECE